MNRSNLIGLAVIGALGLVVGVWQFGGRREPSGPAPVGSPLAPSTRQEFLLPAADAKDDREAPAIAADAEGRVLLAYASESGPRERTIYLARAKGRGAFDEPTPWRTVPIGEAALGQDDPSKPSEVHPDRVLPRLAASGAEITIGWVEAVGGGPELAFYVARTLDGGTTFSDPVPARPPGPSRPGSTAIVADPSGRLDAAWLDGERPFAAGRPTGSGRFEPATPVLDGPAGRGACPCSGLALARPEGGPTFVAFRNEDVDRRDISIARGPVDGRTAFEPPVPVGDHRWSSRGCPHDGPSLALSGGRLVVAWMDAHDGKARAYVADSDPADLAFSPRELGPGSGGSQGHPRIVGYGQGGVVAAWDESLDPSPASAGPGRRLGTPRATPAGPGRAIRVAASGDGRAFTPSRPVDPRPGAFQLDPAIAVLPDGDALVAWNELTEGAKRVVVARVKP